MEKVVDVEYALSTMNNLEFILIKLYKEFLVNNKNLMKDIENLIETDLNEAKRHVHSIKGISTNLGSKKMYEVARDFEEVMKEESVETIKKEFISFKTCFEKMYTEIGEYLKVS
ncbi:Hpt domain-containing protein [Mycoplasmatota bacterium WC44]